MTTSPDQLALQHIQTVCKGHAEALSEALQDMQLRALGTEDYMHLNKDDRRLLDQFAYRYARLQDDMGARLMPSVPTPGSSCARCATNSPMTTLTTQPNALNVYKPLFKPHNNC